MRTLLLYLLLLIAIIIYCFGKKQSTIKLNLHRNGMEGIFYNLSTINFMLIV